MTQADLKIKEKKEIAQRFLDPTNDVAFKKIFATEEHKPSLISFLNAILRLKKEDWIKEVSLLPQEESPLIDGGRRVVFDVRCRDKKGHEFIVEMQNRKVPDFIKRSQYYVSHCYVSQIGKGTPYFELRPVVLVALSNFELFSTSKDPISYHRILDEKTQENHLKDLSYVFVELPKFTKKEEDLITIEDKWLYLLKHAAEDIDVPQTIVEQEIVDAYKTLERFNWSTNDYDAYIRSSITITDEYRRQETRYEEGVEKGRVDGKRSEKIEMAQKMLEKGMGIATISEISGLTEKEIRTFEITLPAKY